MFQSRVLPSLLRRLVRHFFQVRPRLLRAAEDADLLSYGVGVTDLCDVPSARAADLAPEDFTRGIATLRERVRPSTPRALCCNGVGVFRALFGRASARIGRQQDIRLEGAVVFVVPSSSGAAGAFAAQRLAGEATPAQVALAQQLCRDVEAIEDPLTLERWASSFAGEIWGRRCRCDFNVARHDPGFEFAVATIEAIADVGGAGAKTALLAIARLGEYPERQHAAAWAAEIEGVLVGAAAAGVSVYDAV